MRRKIFGLVAATALGIVSAAPAAEAQQRGRVPKIGFLAPQAPCSPAGTYLYREALRKGLQELGYTEGLNIAIECRSAEGRGDRIQGLAGELVRLMPDVIVAADTSSALAAKNATNTIPIVFANSGDPVGLGLVASLSQPGANVTGLSLMAVELTGKRLELLKETVAKLPRVALLFNPDYAPDVLTVTQAQDAARRLRVRLQLREVRAPDELDQAFAAIVRDRADGVLVSLSPLTNENRTRIVSLAAKNRLPAIYGLRESAEAGGLMSYGPSLADNFRRAATYVDKILKGTKPADLPVEQPTRFELVVNLNTTKALGLRIPQSILVRADHVIQ